MVDTDGFLPELNKFTLAQYFNSYLISKYFRCAFLIYFVLSSHKLITAYNVRRCVVLVSAIGVFFVVSIIRMLFDGYLFNLELYKDPLNVLIMGILAVAVSNERSDDEWLLSFAKGALAALILRAIVHLSGWNRVVMPSTGVTVFGFYGTYTIHCLVLVVGCVCYSLAKIHQNAWRKAIFPASLALLNVVVVASSFRRWGLVMCVIEPFLAAAIGYKLKGQLLKRMGIVWGAGTAVVFLIIGIFVLSNGLEEGTDRLISLIAPSSRTSSLDSNLHYLDDQQAFLTLFRERPFGVGYGNFYNVPRLIDITLEDAGDNDGEIPLHVGTYELVARQGVFGIVAICAPVLCLIGSYKRVRNEPNWDAVFRVAFACSAFGLTYIQPYSAPLMGEIKVFAVFGIILGIGIRMPKRSVSANLEPEKSLPTDALAPGPRASRFIQEPSNLFGG